MTSQLPRFLCLFSQLPATKKATENGEAVKLLRSFLFGDDFKQIILTQIIKHLV